MSDTEKPKLITSPWRVVEVFMIYLLASTVGEFAGAAMGEGAQLGIAVLELAIGLGLSIPSLTGKRWGSMAMGLYLLFFGLTLFWLLMHQNELYEWVYRGPLSAFFAAGGLKLMLTKPIPSSENEA